MSFTIYIHTHTVKKTGDRNDWHISLDQGFSISVLPFSSFLQCLIMSGIVAHLTLNPIRPVRGGGGGEVGGLATFPKIYLAIIWCDISWSKQFDISIANVF